MDRRKHETEYELMYLTPRHYQYESRREKKGSPRGRERKEGRRGGPTRRRQVLPTGGKPGSRENKRTQKSEGSHDQREEMGC